MIVEQNLQYLPNFASRVVVMRNGRIFQNDLPLEQLESNEAMFEVFFGSVVVSQ